MKTFVVISVDRTDGLEVKAFGAFKTRKEAEDFAVESIREWVDDRAGSDCICDFDVMTAWRALNPSCRCDWQIEEVEIPA